MACRTFLTSCGLAAIAASTSTAASAQNRSSDNAVTQAEDAFGFSVGRETIGIYNGGQARGFSPTAAGNVRIDGLYFDPAFGLPNTLVSSVSIKVGLSAQGYPFAAPSGIVDQTLRRPAAELAGSTLAAGDSWGGRSVEVEASVPLAGNLGVQIAGNVGKQVFPNGTDNFNHTESVALSWRPADGIEILPFWGRYDDYYDEIGTFYVPAGNYLGIADRPQHDESPKWADVRFFGTNMGVVTRVSLGRDWILRAGAFQSAVTNKETYTFLLVDQAPDGTGERLLFADPPSKNQSRSGEVRLTHSLADGPRLHVFHLSVRYRDARRQFGGSDVVNFGIGQVGERVTDPMPEFDFGEQTRQRVRQTTIGVAYDGRWRDLGEVSFGLSRADYDKRTRIPLTPEVTARSWPWLYNGTAAIILSPGVSAYAGYARGFEESGTAPFTAENRNEPLESIITVQKDAGVRVALTEQLTAVAGLFDLTRPYFGFDSSNVFRKIGSVRSRGFEFSVSGKVTPNLNLVLGGVLLRPRVKADEVVPGVIGKKPFGLPTHILNLNGNWQAPFLTGLQLDLGMSHRGRQPATTDNLVFLDSRFLISTGMRYRFKLSGKAASFRLQATNLLDNNDVGTAAPGIYAPRGLRQFNASLTLDY